MGNDGVVTGTPTYPAGKFGQGISSLSGANHVLLPPPLFNTCFRSGSAWTVECWLKYSAGGSTQVAFQWGATNAAPWMGTNADVFVVTPGDGNQYGTISIADGAFHHCRVVYTGSHLYVFVDGAVSASVAVVLPSVLAASPYVGLYNAGGFQWFGVIDELAGFSTALSTGTFTPPAAPYTGQEDNRLFLYHFDGDAKDGTFHAVSPTAPIVGNYDTTSVNLAWEAATGGTAPCTYQVQRAPVEEAGVPGTWTSLGVAQSGRGYQDTGLTPGADYWYRLKALDVNAAVGYSNGVRVKTLAAAMPVLPALTTPSAALAARYEADSGITLDGSLVSAWSDLSASALTLSGSSTTRPTFRAQSWPGSRSQLSFVLNNSDRLQAASAADWKYLHDGTSWDLRLVWRVTDTDGLDIHTLLDTGGSATNRTGLCIRWNDTTHLIEIFVSNGALNNVSFSVAATARACHDLNVTFDGTTLTVYDWGVLLGTAAKSGTLSTGNPTYPLTLGAEGGGANPMYGNIASLMVHRGAVCNSADRAALDLYQEMRWHPAGNVSNELFLDDQSIAASSGVTRSALTPTKYAGNPLFQSVVASDAWDKDKPFLALLHQSEFSYKLIYGCHGATSPPVLTGYAISTDGKLWSKPIIGAVNYASSFANNLIGDVGEYSLGACYVPGGAVGQKYLRVTGNNGSTIVFGSEDGVTGWTCLKTLDNFFDAGEGGYIVQRPDGRFAVFAEFNSAADLRGAEMFLSDTSDPSGTWTSWGSVLAATAHTDQVYGLQPYAHGETLLGFAAKFNSVNNLLDIDLYVSRDYGWTWTLAQAAFIPRGAGSAWDSKSMFSAGIARSGADWLVYYSGGDQDHSVDDAHLQIGYATLAYERIGQVTGTGTLTTRALYRPGGLLRVNADASGGTLTAACLDSTGAVIPGYGHAQSTVVSEDTRGAVITWGRIGLPSQGVRIELALTAATVYALGLSDVPDRAQPFVVAVVASGNSIVLSWTAVHGATGYEIFRLPPLPFPDDDRPDPASAVYLATVDADTLTYTDTAPLSGKSWYNVDPEV